MAQPARAPSTILSALPGRSSDARRMGVSPSGTDNSLHRVEGEFLKFAAHVRRIAVGQPGSLDEHDDDDALLRIGPGLGAEGAAVAERAGRQHRGHTLGLPDDGEAEAKA